MRRVVIHGLTLIVLIASCMAPEKDSVREAQAQNEAAKVDGRVSKFLTEAADARLTDLREAELGVAVSASPAIRKYALLMVEEQTAMLNDLRKLATSKNIHLPDKLSDKKSKQVKTLQALRGERFDKKFIHTMMLDHKHDVREFKQAKDFHDKDVKQYATTYYPVVESHLKKIRSLKNHLTESNL